MTKRSIMYGLAYGISIGVGVGISFGVALENMAIGISIGLGSGVSLGVGCSLLLSKRKSCKSQRRKWLRPMFGIKPISIRK